MKVVEEVGHLQLMEGEWSVKDIIQQVVDGGVQEDPFYVMDLGEVVARYNTWRELMPRVKPFYAVKCNDDKLLVTLLAALGTGFDCASKAEIELVTSLGVQPERIIFANPAKMASHIRYANGAGVNTFTFDSETELMKFKQLMPHAQLVIRIRCDAKSAQCPLGIKFGCDPQTEAPRLLKLAAVMNLNVVGVSFHVGSGAHDFEVYGRAVSLARALFALGADVGHKMRLLDLGGGFPGGRNDSIVEVSRLINSALDTHFPGGCVEVIAEPGRFFACAAYTLATCVYATRELPTGEGGDRDDAHMMYFMNDGVYGSFNCILYDHQVVTPELLQPSSAKQSPCSVWGPTCDGLDCVLPAARLPRLAAGAWLLWRDMGAYTLPVASTFNGFPLPTVRPVVDANLWRALLKDLWPLSESRLEVVGAAEAEGITPPPSPPPKPLCELSQVFVECALK